MRGYILGRVRYVRSVLGARLNGFASLYNPVVNTQICVRLVSTTSIRLNTKDSVPTDTIKRTEESEGSSGENFHKRPPGTYMIWAMEAIGSTSAFLYFLYLYTDIFESNVPGRLNPDKYIPFTLLEKEPLTTNTSRFRFQINRPGDDKSQEQNVNEIINSGSWAVDVKDHMVQTYRTYTPIDYTFAKTANEDGIRQGYFDLIVKRYPRGSLSRFLHDTKVGDKVEMRGPILTWPYKPGTYNHIYMIAGGTGFAPMFQLIERILHDTDDKTTRISLLYGSRSENDIIYCNKLKQLVKDHKDQLQVRFIVDHGPATISDVGYISPRLVQEFTKEFSRESDIVLVCGPDAMMDKICGTRPIGPHQGLLQGILKDLGFSSKDVFKF